MSNSLAIVRQEFANNRTQIQGAIPEGVKLNADRLINLALLAATKSPELLECSPASIVQSVRQAAALGLEVGGPLGEAYIVKYGAQAQLIPGYRGYVALALRTGKVRHVEARLVYKDDVFRVTYGLDPNIEHTPDLDGARADEDIVAAYMVATLTNGVKQFEVMTRAELEKVRQVSKSKDRGPWRDWYPEQCKKTVIRRGSKLLPLSSEFSEAAELENRAEVGQVGGLTRFDTERTLARELADRTADSAHELRDRVAASRNTKQIASPSDDDSDETIREADRKLVEQEGV